MLTFALGVLKRRIRSVHTDHRRIAKGAVIVSVFVFLGKGAGAFKEMAVAYRYGIGGTVDAYQLALTLVSWLPLTVIGELSILLVPLFVAMRDKKEEMAQFLAEIEGVCMLLGVVLTSLLLLSWPLLAHFTASNLSESTRTMCLYLLMGLAPVGVLSFTVCITAARLQAREKHINTLLESVPALVLLCLVLVVPRRDSLLPLMLGTSLGVAVQALLLRLCARNVDGQTARPRLSFRSPHWRKTLHSVSVLMVGGVIVSMITPVDQYFLAQVGDGAIATYGYAYRVLTLLIGIGALAISRAILPILSEMLAAKDATRARNTALKWSLVMLAIGALGAPIAYALAPWMVELLFQRGAFTADDARAVTLVFRTGLIQIPFAFAGFVVIQLFVSEARYRALTFIAVVSFVVKAGGNVLLAPLYGAQGVMLATGLMTAACFVCYLVFLKQPSGQPRAIAPHGASEE
ncbi:Virulence factor MVIN family protein [Burkholderia sp. 8Y]|uniref:murein biosynthesis integral membrane protein MurJ n=1 Tax=Burkholderia sp. 8Y TaxID=2653133 RepID=UPI0012EFA63C|nr:lipid II flippase MurJ [Burkholderia sp. 8Y]VXA95081.1 Virulence factor MVIN family protein [Burkholderia sp. 8Y]